MEALTEQIMVYEDAFDGETRTMGWFHFAHSFLRKDGRANIPKDIWGVNFGADECECGCGAVDSLVIYDEWNGLPRSIECYITDMDAHYNDVHTAARYGAW